MRYRNYFRFGIDGAKYCYERCMSRPHTMIDEYYCCGKPSISGYIAVPFREGYCVQNDYSFGRVLWYRSQTTDGGCYRFKLERRIESRFDISNRRSIDPNHLHTRNSTRFIDNAEWSYKEHDELIDL